MTERDSTMLYNKAVENIGGRRVKGHKRKAGVVLTVKDDTNAIEKRNVRQHE